jgi:hypothetical protein
VDIILHVSTRALTHFRSQITLDTSPCQAYGTGQSEFTQSSSIAVIANQVTPASSYSYRASKGDHHVREKLGEFQGKVTGQRVLPANRSSYA